MKEVTKKRLLKWKPVKVVLIHSTVGAAVFYFFVHPLTMIIYWLEFNKIELSYHSFMDAFLIRIENLSILKC